MNGNFDENNLNNPSLEHFNSQEINNNAGEFSPPNSENFVFLNNPTPPEILEQTNSDTTKKQNKNLNDINKLKSIMQMLTVTTVTVASGAVILNPIITQNKIKLLNEDISFNSYECVLELNNVTDDLTASILGENGESYHVKIPNGNAYTLTLDGLTPQVEYDITVLDSAGKTHYEGEFETEPFITFYDIDESKKSFKLHSDFMLDGDLGLRLYNKTGNDFSSNLTYDFLDPSYNILYLNGLYKDEYIVEMQVYIQDLDEPITYKTFLNLGSLTPLEYTATFNSPNTTDASQLNLTYISGDLLPYTPVEVRLINVITDEWFFSDTVTTSENNVSATFLDTITSGTYSVILVGECETENYSLYNDIFKTNITI